MRHADHLRPGIGRLVLGGGLRAFGLVGKGRFGPGLAAPTFDPRGEPVPCLRGADTDKVHVHHRLEQPGGVEVLDADRDQPPLFPQRIASKRHGPLGLAMARLQVLRREHRHRHIGPLRRLVHGVHEVAADGEIPGLDPRLVPCRLHLPGDPLRPPAIGLRVADEDLERQRHPSQVIERQGSYRTVASAMAIAGSASARLAQSFKPRAKRSAASTCEIFSGRRRVMSFSSLDWGRVTSESRLATQGLGRPSSGPRAPRPGRRSSRR